MMMNIYQIFVGRWDGAHVLKHRNKVFERLSSFEWRSLSNQGFTHVYLLGVFDYQGELYVSEETGKDIRGVEDRIPSCFAISNHKDTHPWLGSLKEFKQLVEIIQQSGLKVILDFVPNQTGRNHLWVEERPDFYMRENGEMKADFSGDVLRLDYRNVELREEMMKILEFVSSDLNADVLRCDMAHLTPLDFWSEAISKIKRQKPGIVFVAEAYSSSVFDWKPLVELLEVGFDYVYDEFLYRNIKKWAEEDKLEYLVEYVNYLTTLDSKNNWLHYLSNHDDEVPFSDTKYVGVLVILMLMLPGSLLVFNGSLNGYSKRLMHHVVESLSDDELEISRPVKWFESGVNFKRQYKAEAVNLERQGDLLRVDLKTIGTGVKMYLNLSAEDVSLPQSNQANVDLISGEVVGAKLGSGGFVVVED